MNAKRKALIRHIRYWYFLLPIEAVIWTAGLIGLAIYNPFEGQHLSVCVFDNLGFRYCPGCGIGRSVSFLLHGDVRASFEAHPLGFIAILLLSFRIGKLVKDFIKDLKNQKLKYNG